MNILLNIPAHTKCNNCGKCCGLVPVTVQEIHTIKKYLLEHKQAQNFAVQHSKQGLTCPFRNEKDKKCEIYDVRPLICRLFGVVEGKFMQCPQGNTTKINGFKFMDFKEYAEPKVLNDVNWNQLND